MNWTGHRAPRLIYLWACLWGYFQMRLTFVLVDSPKQTTYPMWVGTNQPVLWGGMHRTKNREKRNWSSFFPLAHRWRRHLTHLSGPWTGIDNIDCPGSHDVVTSKQCPQHCGWDKTNSHRPLSPVEEKGQYTHSLMGRATYCCLDRLLLA